MKGYLPLLNQADSIIIQVSLVTAKYYVIQRHRARGSSIMSIVALYASHILVQPTPAWPRARNVYSTR